MKTVKITLTVMMLMSVCLMSFAQCDENVNVMLTPEDDDNVYCPYDTLKFTTQETYDSYQWYYNFSNSTEGGTAFTGETDQLLQFNIGQLGFGYIYVEVSQDTCTYLSEPILVDSWLFLNPVIISNPEPQYCIGDSTQVAIGSGIWENIQWYRNGAVYPGATDSVLWVIESGTYVVNASPALCPELELTSGVGPSFEFEGPDVPVITQNGNELTSSSGPNYQWMLNGTDILGATEQTYIALESGTYTVRVSDGSGCEPVSEPVEVVISATGNELASNVILSPNPVQDVLSVENLPQGLTALQLISPDGKLIRRWTLNGDLFFKENVSALSPGIYYLRLIRGERVGNIRFVKQ